MSDHGLQLTPEKRARLEALLRQENLAPAGRTLIPPRQGSALAPLSFAQERLWFLDQLEGGSSAYNVPLVYRITGPLDLAALEWSLNQVIQRHEALRTHFEVLNGEIYQVAAPAMNLEIEVEDLQALPHAQRETEMLQRVFAEGRRLFDLRRGPLVHACCYRLAHDESVFVLNLHHNIIDEWSVAILFQDLKAFYQNRLAGDPIDLPPLPIQYADYAAWQRQHLQGEALQRLKKYWLGHLSGAPESLDLPFDYPRPAVRSYRGANLRQQLPADMLEQINQLAQREHTTPFVVTLAAFYSLLYRYTGQDDLVVGIPAANRDLPELQNLVGFFLNTLALRLHISGDLLFEEVLRRTREMTLAGLEHQDLPFEHVVELLRVERGLSQQPLFQVMFIFGSQDRLELPGLAIESLRIDYQVAKFDLSLILLQQKDSLALGVEYSADLFTAATIQRLIEHYINLLASALENPRLPVSRLGLISEQERRRLIMNWNTTAFDFPDDDAVHQLVARQAAQTPEAPALLFEGQTITYRQLNQRANRLAYQLIGLGVGPDTLVGVCMERSPEMVAALLGVLKAGGAYTPLDPANPPERLAFMASDAGLTVILTQPALLEKLAAIDARRLVLDGDFSLPDEDIPDPAPLLDPLHAAYMIYTSGSTGKPKGVLISHRSLLNLLYWMQGEFPLTPQDRLLLKTVYSFDVSVWEIFAPLVWGASLAIASADGHRDAAYLAQTLLDHSITHLQVVPSQLAVLVEQPQFWQWCESEPQRRWILCAGEALQHELAERLLSRTTVNFYNIYGPTETTVYSAYWRCRPGEQGRVPIGRPLGNTRLYVLDVQLQPAPLGVAGELYIGGEGVARGYHRRPGLTAERFVPDPFSQQGGRLYRTGDLARWRPDGVIEYLGRIDNQVKLRGFRIELGEIENRLAAHPLVQQALVTATGAPLQEQRLVAYVVAPQGQRPPRQKLLDYLRAQLPDYMIPAALVYLDAFPLLPNGKVNRKALPTPEMADLSERPAYIAPRTPLERALADIWAALLKLERVGVEDNFFDLGGHSLLATQLIIRLRDQLGLQLPLRAVFEHPTIAGLARQAQGLPSPTGDDREVFEL